MDRLKERPELLKTFSQGIGTSVTTGAIKATQWSDPLSPKFVSLNDFDAFDLPIDIYHDTQMEISSRNQDTLNQIQQGLDSCKGAWGTLRGVAYSSEYDCYVWLSSSYRARAIKGMSDGHLRESRDLVKKFQNNLSKQKQNLLVSDNDMKTYICQRTQDLQRQLNILNAEIEWRESNSE